MFDFALLALQASDATVVVTSIVLVFAMLVALCLIISAEGKLFDRMKGRAAQPARPAQPEPVKASAPAPKPAAPAPAADGAIPGEVVAAIAAAVACCMGDEVTITGIRRVPQQRGSRRGAWGDAGVAAQTTPFGL